ncbi:DivIVA domain-containing protein [Bifidobacterium callitrichidarum]|uniref:Cell division protein DivIVA n=1 Tax=Bifidobacterium callitrichidarum TaxID=2052941 RepID=A0A2U2N945_9BIFI|nr:DivIVA domain-containing protein [Bifidobacterium callitrichidarum]PWG65623.1 cell division protein DivIVA [Bifidobacterium callitrichidarum]
MSIDAPEFKLVQQSACYEPYAVDLLVRLAEMTVHHPDDVSGLTADEVRHLNLPCRYSGYATDEVDEWLDGLADRLEELGRS